MAESVTEPRVGGPEDVMALCEALLTLRDGEEMRRFLRDLTTPGEMQALAERWRVARLLAQQRHRLRRSCHSRDRALAGQAVCAVWPRTSAGRSGRGCR